MVPLSEYAQIKDIYCLRYLGQDKQIILELQTIAPLIERKYGLVVRLVFGDTNEKFSGITNITDWYDLEKLLLESDLPLPIFKKEPHIYK